jgi:hypothetical protein
MPTPPAQLAGSVQPDLEKIIFALSPQGSRAALSNDGGFEGGA